MSFNLGIRREDKNKWERRVPIVPEDVQMLKKQYDIESTVQPSSIRVFSGEEYQESGAVVHEDLSSCPVILAIKEIPIDFFESGKTYLLTSKYPPNGVPVGGNVYIS